MPSDLRRRSKLYRGIDTSRLRQGLLDLTTGLDTSRLRQGLLDLTTDFKDVQRHAE
jgi:hypothetical protein